MPTDVERPESYAFTDTDQTALGQAATRRMANHPGKSGFHLLTNGLDAFVARMALASRAERSIDAQYYLYHDDLVGRLFTDQLLKAADRGVQVRLLVDDMDLAGRGLGGAVLDSHPNMQVRIFNPFSRQTHRMTQFITRMDEVTRRMHNKSFTVDNQVAVLGGRNIGNEYFEADPDLAFADLDVMAIGPIVKDVSSAFDQYWNSELAYPATALLGKPPTLLEIDQMRAQWDDFVAGQNDSIYMQALYDSELADKIRDAGIRYDWGGAELVYDQPEKLLNEVSEADFRLTPRLRRCFHDTREELIIFSPYFVPGKPGTAALTQLAASGVRVRVLTNSLASNDVGLVHAGYAKYRKDLLRGGVELYELNKQLSRQQRHEKKGTGGSAKASLHAKSFVFDRSQVYIGSLNLDPRAIVHNTEIGVLFHSSDIGIAMALAFDKIIQERAFRLQLEKTANGSEAIHWHGWVDGQAQTFTTDPHTSFWRRLGIGFMGLLPIESQL